MKCFYHPDYDAVGICNQCKKSSCKDCIVDIGGALLCVGCVELSRQHYAEQQRTLENDIQTARTKEIQSAERRLLLSWIVAGFGFAFGFFPAIGMFKDKNTIWPFFWLVANPFIFAYMFWSTFWVIPSVWGWMRRTIFTGENGESKQFGFWISMLVFFWVCLLQFAIYYGMLGGGIYQFLKTKRFLEESAVQGT